MSAIAIIPARAGSKRIPEKNIRLFHGKPIIAYSILAAKASGLFARIIVSTDSDLIGAIAMDYGASYLRRHSRLADDDTGTQEVTRDALNGCGPGIEHACCIYPTAPMMTPEDLRTGRKLLDEQPWITWAFVPGWYYWGSVGAFLARTPLGESPHYLMMGLTGRYIDINTEEDWIHAKQMYAAWRRRLEGDTDGVPQPRQIL